MLKTDCMINQDVGLQIQEHCNFKLFSIRISALGLHLTRYGLSLTPLERAIGFKKYRITLTLERKNNQIQTVN